MNHPSGIVASNEMLKAQRHFAKTFSTLLEAYEVTPKHLSTVTGIPVTQIYDWRSGAAHPRLYRLIQLADYFGVSLDDLVGRDFDAA